MLNKCNINVNCNFLITCNKKTWGYIFILGQFDLPLLKLKILIESKTLDTLFTVCVCVFWPVEKGLESTDANEITHSTPTPT